MKCASHSLAGGRRRRDAASPTARFFVLFRKEIELCQIDKRPRFAGYALVLLGAAVVDAQSKPTAAGALRQNFQYINNKLLEMAQDFPADKYNYKLKPALRSFGAIAALKAHPEGPAKNMQPFLSVLQHASEHYGLLLANYRANGLVPPDSRPKK